MKKTNYVVLAAVFISFLALGMPDGAFGVAWPSIRYDMGLGLDRAFILVVTHSIFYAISGWQMGRLAKALKLPNVNMLGLVMLIIGVAGFAASPNLYFLVLTTIILGTGMGFVDAGLNAYAAKYFESRHMNWLHCFWGLGGSISPIIMSQMIIFAGWRTGYVSIMALQGIMAVFVLFTLLKGFWVMMPEKAQEEAAVATGKKFLSQKNILTQFFVWTLYIIMEEIWDFGSICYLI